MSQLQLRIIDRKGRDLTTVSISPNNTTDDLKKMFHATFKKWYPTRQYFTIGDDPKTRKVLTPGTTLESYGLKNNDTLIFKDLGPQISWKTVFHVEYAGPILMHALFYYLPNLFYPGYQPEQYVKSYTQTVAFWCVVLHYLKREYETHFVHRFSNATMPLFNIFKNSTHYWIFGGALIAYFLYHPLYTETKSHLVVNICAVLFFICEWGNFKCHCILRDLRKPGTRDRGIPRGFMFEYTTCGNYTFEVFAWIVFAYFTQTLTAYLFCIISTAQIALWSIKKHVALKKEFGDAVPRRKILFPFIW